MKDDPMEDKTSEEQTVLSATEARDGKPVKGMPAVLLVSIVGAVIVLGLAFLVLAG